MGDEDLGKAQRDLLVETYLRYTSRHDELDAWAYDRVSDLLHDEDPVGVWDVVLQLLRGASDDVLGNVAAGPLEDMVRLHGNELIANIEREADQDSRFHRALGSIWLSHGELPPAILDRVVRASGGRI